MKRLTSLLTFVSFAVLLIICPAGHGAGTIKIGIVDTYTGPPTTYTADVLDGFRLAVDKINAKGGQRLPISISIFWIASAQVSSSTAATARIGSPWYISSWSAPARPTCSP